jgi:cell division protein ZapA
MSVVSVKIGGKDYKIACDDGQEERLTLLAEEIDDRVSSLVFSMGKHPGEAMALLLTALTMADETIENKKEIDKQAAELKRLRTLVDQESLAVNEAHLAEMESAMAMTLEEIAARIEKIADQIEIR